MPWCWQSWRPFWAAQDSSAALQALQDADAYGGAPLVDVQQELLGKQMQSFGKKMALLRDRMCVFDHWPPASAVALSVSCQSATALLWPPQYRHCRAAAVDR